MGIPKAAKKTADKPLHLRTVIPKAAADFVRPAWIAALQTLRREIEDEVMRDAGDRRDVEHALMIVREIEFAHGECTDGVPAAVLDEDRRNEAGRFPFRVDRQLMLLEPPDGPNWADLRYKTAGNLWYDAMLAPRFVERGIFTSWDERHRGMLIGSEADRERARASRLNDLLERGVNCLAAMPAAVKQRFSDHVWQDYWLQCLFELGCQGTNAPLNMAFKKIWCRDEEGEFAAWCRTHECLFPVDWKSREREFRRIQHHLGNRNAEIPPTLLIREPTTYLVTMDDILRQSLHMIDWLCEPANLNSPRGDDAPESSRRVTSNGSPRRKTIPRCGDRDKHFMALAESGKTNKQIAATWNAEHPEDNVSDEAVKKAVQRFRDKKGHVP